MATETYHSELKERSGVPQPPEPPASAGKDEISLLDLLIIVAERKMTVLYVTAAVAVVSVIVVLLLPSWYTAEVTLLTPQQNSSLGSAIASQLGSLGPMAALAGAGGLGLKSPNDMYVAMLKSQTVEDGMVQRFHLESDYKEKR
ncbi:MAG TPA: Wzz/FepE/Etk N-terminal domain-containing protein, partial [Acidobacteriaceae bacterium]|nr:Wzz/FepE/Etk N-terminal domain-containing protein [Acidobacteriaceae bacterium]